MNRKLIFSIFFLLGLSAGMQAQQRPHYTQYILNNFVLNPAVTGIENYTDLKISARDQWVGLNGAPRTVYLTVHGPIGKKDYKTSATSFEVPGQNPRGSAYWETYTASEPHHGVGFTVINDQTGSFNRFSANASYAYHLGLNPTTNLSAGFSAGITMLSLDKSKTDFGGGDPSDPAAGTVSSELNRVRPDISFGVWLYSKNYFAGIAAQQIVPQRIAFVDDAPFAQTGRLVPHLFATAGYRFLLHEDINAVPSLMVKYVNGTPTNPQVEGNLKLQYRDQFWVGGSYRYKDGFAAMAGLNVGNTFNVGYAYDFTQTRLNTTSRGTHEIILGFLLGNKYSEACPRCNW
jgi:type IX secretion system PorP/SprF family membrane protein